LFVCVYVYVYGVCIGTVRWIRTCISFFAHFYLFFRH
jgi:hypothetical protein